MCKTDEFGQFRVHYGPFEVILSHFRVNKGHFHAIFAEPTCSLKLTEKIVSLETEITRSVSNIIHTNNQLQCSIYENARFKNSIQNYDLVPKKLVSQHQKGLIQHQQTLFSPMQIVNGRPMLFTTGNFHYHYPLLPSCSYGKTATK